MVHVCLCCMAGETGATGSRGQQGSIRENALLQRDERFLSICMFCMYKYSSRKYQTLTRICQGNRSPRAVGQKEDMWWWIEPSPDPWLSPRDRLMGTEENRCGDSMESGRWADWMFLSPVMRLQLHDIQLTWDMLAGRWYGWTGCVLEVLKSLKFDLLFWRPWKCLYEREFSKNLMISPNLV